MKSRDRVFGALNIYAAEEDAFDYEEFNLLTELAEDLSLGMDALRARAECDLAKARLRESESWYPAVDAKPAPLRS